jgi:hypothetical protein
VYPVIDPLTSIGKRGKHRFTQELFPYRSPQPLDLAQSHGVMGCASDIVNPLLLEHLLEPCATSPGYKLPPIIGENLPRRSPLADRTLGYLQNRIGALPTEQSPARDVARVIVDDTHQVHRVHPFELEREDIDLPQCIRQHPLKLAFLRRTSVCFRWGIA